MNDLQRLKIDRSRSQPTAPRRRAGGGWLWRLLVLGALAVLGFVFRRQLAEVVDRFQLPTVRTAVVTEGSKLATSAVAGTAANGYVVAARRAALSADTPGRIVELHVEEGSVVEAGELVARLFSDEYEAALRRAEAELRALDATLARIAKEVDARAVDVESAKRLVAEAEARVTEAAATVDEADARLELARANDRRAQALYTEGVETEMRRDETVAELARARAGQAAARAARESAAAALRSAETGIDRASAALALAESTAGETEARRAILVAQRDQARATLDKTEVRAPFDGIVVLKDAEVGEVVSPNSQGGSNARGSVVTMVDFASLEVQVDVPETNLAKVTQGAPAVVYLDAYPDRPYAAHVDRIWPTADRQKATVEVRVVFEEPDRLLRPEMGARVVFEPQADEGAEPEPAASEGANLLMPVEALVRRGGTTGTFVLEGERVRFQELELGPERAGRQIVRAGLAPGDRVVLTPPAGLEDGDRVRIEG